MKSLLFLILITGLVNGGMKFYEPEKKGLAQEDPRILKIREWYGEIQNGLKNKEYEIKYEGDAVLYYNKANKKLIHVNVGVYNDGHEFVEEYYIKNDKLFFYYSEEISVNETQPLPEGMSEQEAWETGAMYDAKNYNVVQKRIYFDNSKIIRLLSKEAIVESGKNVSEEMLKINNKKVKVSSIDAAAYFSKVESFKKLGND